MCSHIRYSGLRAHKAEAHTANGTRITELSSCGMLDCPWTGARGDAEANMAVQALRVVAAVVPLR